MKITLWVSIFTSIAAASSVRAQGTLVFDQQSSTAEPGLAVGVRFQDNQPFAQSFMPTLSSIGFVRLFMYPGGPASPDATVYVNLLSDSISGPALGSTDPITIHNYFSGYTNFYFATPVTLRPGTTYYLQPVAAAGNPVTSIGGGFTYLNGNVFISGVEQIGENLWFREGVIIPEPGSLVLAGLAAALYFSSRTARLVPRPR